MDELIIQGKSHGMLFAANIDKNLMKLKKGSDKSYKPGGKGLIENALDKRMQSWINRM